MIIVKKMTGVVLLALAMTAVPLAAALADQSERTAVERSREGGGQQPLPSAGKPELFIYQPHYDAGEVWEGDEVVHTFIIQNRGTALLEITRVNPG